MSAITPNTGQELTKRLLAYATVLEPFADVIQAPEGVQLMLRRKGKKQYLFVLNYMPQEQTITLHREATLLYTGETVQGKITLPPFGTAVYAV